MTRNTRFALLGAAVVVAVVAFVIAQSGGDDNNDNAGGSQAASETTTTETTSGSETQTAQVTTLRVSLKGAEPVGGVQTLTATKGDTVRLVISADAADEVHLHGYDLEKEAEPGKPAVIRFKANLEGAFELESHTAEHGGKEPLIARLHVEP